MAGEWMVLVMTTDRDGDVGVAGWCVPELDAGFQGQPDDRGCLRLAFALADFGYQL